MTAVPMVAAVLIAAAPYGFLSRNQLDNHDALVNPYVSANAPAFRHLRPDESDHLQSSRSSTIKILTSANRSLLE